MIRNTLAEKAGGFDSAGFRLRGRAVSRLEGLTDGVFALAMALMIVSVQVPGDYASLMAAIRMLPAFAICFAILMWFWAMHYTLSRRYGLEDRAMLALNSALLFLVLFYVFPLKFLFSGMVGGMMGIAGAGRLSEDQARQLFLLYGAGYGSIAAVFALMHAHAYRLRAQLEFTPLELHLVRESMVRSLSQIGIALVSVVLALTLPARWLAVAGITYAATGCTEGVLGWWFGKGAAKFGPKPKG